MPVRRDFECVNCRQVEENVQARPERGLLCPNCGSVMVSIITLGTVQRPTDALWPMMHPHLGHVPVEVKSWRHYKQLLKDRNFSNELAS